MANFWWSIILADLVRSVFNGLLCKEPNMKHGADCWRSFIIPVGVILELNHKHCVTLLQWASVVMMAEVVNVLGPDGTTRFWKFLGPSKSALVIRPNLQF